MSPILIAGTVARLASAWATARRILLGLLFAVGLALAIVHCGCGASPATREAYTLETLRCVANEQAIVDREGTTADEDREALALERARCDAALGAIQ